MSVPQLDLAEFDAHLRNAHAKRKARPKKVREATVEAAHRDDVKANGGEAYKFTSPGRRAVPDRLDLYGVERMVPVLSEVLFALGASQPSLHEARATCERLLAAAVEFTECKKPSTPDATDAQKREHERLRARGFKVNVLAHVKPTAPKPRKPRKKPPAAVPTYEELFT